MDKLNFTAFCLVILVAFALAMCGVLVFSMINNTTNIAYAGYVIDTGYAPNNLFTNNWCEDWSFNVDATSNTILNPVVFYEDDTWAYSIYGGTLVDNHMSSNSHIVLTLKKNFDATGKYVHFLLGVSMGYTLSNMSVSFHSINYNASTTYVSSSSSYSWGGSTKQDSTARDLSIGSYFIINCTGSNGYLRFICLQVSNANNQSGYVPKTYSNYGYDQGYTDGVNSSSGGTSDIPLDLTNVSWRSPSTATVSNVDGLYDVDGSFDSSYLGSSFTFDQIQLVSGNTIFGEDGEYSPMYLINSSLSVGDGTIPVMANELLTFTGGEDVANTELINWLQSNNGFLTYTDGYQDGYNDGLDIGYDNGYYDGIEDATINNPYVDNLPLSFYAANTSYAEFGDIFSHNTINYNGINYNSDYADTSYEINDVYRYEFTAEVDSSSSLGITFKQSFNAMLFNISFGVDYNSTYNSLKGILIHNSDYSNNYYYAVEGSNNVFKVRTESDNRAIYYTLNVQLDSVDVYYISLLFNDDVVQGDNQATACLVLPYVIGSDDGNNIGVAQSSYEDGYNDGKYWGDNVGYYRGRTDGFTVGYNQALAEHSNYTFLGLLTSVVEAPVNVVGDMLDFELLGFNLKAFFFSMISIALFIFILKLFI